MLRNLYYNNNHKHNRERFVLLQYYRTCTIELRIPLLLQVFEKQPGSGVGCWFVVCECVRGGMSSVEGRNCIVVFVVSS